MKEGKESVNVAAPKSTTSIFEDAPPLFCPALKKCSFSLLCFISILETRLCSYALVLLGFNTSLHMKKQKKMVSTICALELWESTASFVFLLEHQSMPAKQKPFLFPFIGTTPEALDG